LTVEGQDIRAPIPADPEDPRFVDQLIEKWERGAAAGEQAVGALQAKIEAVEVSEDSSPWTYDLVVRNMGQGPVNFLTVFDTVAINGQAQLTQRVASLGTLPAGQSWTEKISKDLPLPISGLIGIAVTVVGFGPQGNALYASATKLHQFRRVEPPA